MDNPTLLIVDDIPSNIDVLGSILMEEYTIQAATCGEDALDIARDTPKPDLILLDVMMPGMDGYQVLTFLKQDPATRDIPVIMVTACTDPGDEIQGFYKGCVDYIHKPVSAPIVLSRVRAHVESKRMRDSLSSRLVATQADSHRHEQFFTGLFEHSPQGILLLDETHTIVRVNKAFCDLFGFKEKELLGQSEAMLTVPMAETKSYQELLGTIKKGGTLQAEGQRMRVDGSAVSVSIVGCRVNVENQDGGLFLIYEDISERKLAEKRLTHQAYHDPLTGIDNRLAFMELLKEELSKSTQLTESCVMLLDLDRFKSVNDSLGHPVGDALLQIVAQRFKKCLRDRDVVARIGGDEFALLLKNTHGTKEAEGIAKRLLDAAKAPFQIDDQILHIGASIGIVYDISQYTAPAPILRNADLAMYHAKENGKGCFTLFDDSLHEKAVHRLKMENDVRDAFERDEFTLYYQPVVPLPQGRVHQFEALIRWNHPEKGVLPPGAFLHVMEESGLSTSLRCWLVTQAAKTLACWQDIDPERILNINLSAGQLADPELCPFLEETFTSHRAPLNRLVVEITETDLMEGRSIAEANLNRLRGLEVGIAIDDFGTGYSSLAYLHRFHIDTVKIDRTFISRIHKDGMTIVSAVGSISKKLGISVVAEGIEELHQLKAATRAGCTHGQGYLIARPMPLERVEGFVRSRNAKPQTSSKACDVALESEFKTALQPV